MIQRKLRKIKEKDSDHGRHMKGFDRLKVRDPQIFINQDSVAIPQEEEVEVEDVSEGFTDDLVPEVSIQIWLQIFSYVFLCVAHIQNLARLFARNISICPL